ncbi:MAG: DUF4416 family protein [Spirochaetia bacterium]|nr:DUF4416 family protein [Spirochaetia bacterium]
MNNVRVYFLIAFSQTDTLIDFFSAIENAFGRYDFFTQDIKFPYELKKSPKGAQNKIRIVSLKKPYRISQMKSFLNKTLKIQKKLARKGNTDFNITCGYVTPEQIISLHPKEAPLKIYMQKNIYARVQFALIDKKIIPFYTAGEEFSLPEVKKFFLDLQRLFKDR